MPAALLELSTPTLFPVLCGVLGLVVGSFLNVVIYRLPKMMEQDWQAQCAELCASEAPAETATANAANNISSPPSLSLARPGSHCPHCQHAITARENIPLLSWLCLRGRCSSCQHSISVRYPLVELLSASLSAYCAVHFGFGWIALGAIILVWCLIVLSLIDVDTQLLPDSITLPLLWLGLLFNLFGVYTDLGSAVVGAMLGYLSLWSVYWAFKLLTGKEGMGYGDFKLLAALGAWLGWSMLPLIILLSSFVGAVIGIVMMILTQRGRNVPIPFGPYLAIAGLLALFCGQELTQSYLHLI